MVGSGRRDFKIKSRDGVRVIAKSSWTKTIMDVRTEPAELYCGDVTAWAWTVLQEAEEIRI
jgi:hypothetical protein